jgi:hypothetical protein
MQIAQELPARLNFGEFPDRADLAGNLPKIPFSAAHELLQVGEREM